MLNAEEIQALLTDLESDRVERTTSTSNTDKFAEAICAFANDYPNHRQPGGWQCPAATRDERRQVQPARR